MVVIQTGIKNKQNSHTLTQQQYEQYKYFGTTKLQKQKYNNKNNN